MNSLHTKLMNLPCEPNPDWLTAEKWYFRRGHRDARHAAAELAMAADARIRQLEDVVRRYVASDVERDAYHDDTTMQDSDLHRCALAALKGDPS